MGIKKVRELLFKTEVLDYLTPKQEKLTDTVNAFLFLQV